MSEVTKQNKPPLPHHTGHRQRLRQKFRDGGEKALADYEFLELLLQVAIPRRDTKPLAKELIGLFGSYAEVIAAPANRLSEVKGVGDTVITTLKLVEASAQKLSRHAVLNKPVLVNWDALIDYCQSQMAYLKVEQFRLLFLDHKNRLIADEVQQVGTVDQTSIYPREVVKRALELQSSAIIMVHNHPSGDPKPSKSDLQITRKIQAILEPLDVKLHDHLIISKSGHNSFRSMGLL